jgi:hypothetical protein
VAGPQGAAAPETRWPFRGVRAGDDDLKSSRCTGMAELDAAGAHRRAGGRVCDNTCPVVSRSP